jgi:hypothetical protein
MMLVSTILIDTRSLLGSPVGDVMQPKFPRLTIQLAQQKMMLVASSPFHTQQPGRFQYREMP